MNLHQLKKALPSSVNVKECQGLYRLRSSPIRKLRKKIAKKFKDGNKGIEYFWIHEFDSIESV